MTHDELIKVIAADRDEKVIQWQRNGSGWIDHGNIRSILTIAGLIQNGYELRIKPEPKTRLIRTDELPAVFWVKYAETKDYADNEWALIVAVKEEAIKTTDGGWIGIGPCHENGLIWSPDRKEVRSFMVEYAS